MPLRFLDINSDKIPLKIIREKRMNVRYSITRKHVMLRTPRFFGPEMIQQEIEKLTAWCAKQFERNPVLAQRFKPVKYNDRQVLHVLGEPLRLIFETKEGSNIRTKFTPEKKELIIRIPRTLEWFEADARRNAVQKTLAKICLPIVTRRVHELNEQYYGETVNSVRLKNNVSNWGSCSARKNINLSLRLLLAPPEILDYVIIHELAHLRELNHSTKFWSIIENIDPDYKKKEHWLKAQGHKLRV